MIDINELRRLAQSATPGNWQFWHGWVAADIDNDGGVIIVERPTPSGGKYQARVDSNFKFIAAANPATISELLDRLEAAESTRRDDYQNWMTALDRNAELLAKLEAAEKERATDEECIADLMADLNRVGHENDALRTALEKIADWDSAWGPYPETNEAWRAMVIVTAREAVPRRGEKK